MKQSIRLILASQSQARRNLLDGAGLEFEVAVADVDEPAVRERALNAGRNAGQIAGELAVQKALDVAARYPDCLVIGADQILEFQGEILSKPKDRAAARKQLQKLRGQTHRLLSAVCIVQNQDILWQYVDHADLTMHGFDDHYIDSYLERAGSGILNCVGCYMLEGIGVHLFRTIEGNYFTILGIPLLELLSSLSKIDAMS